MLAYTLLIGLSASPLFGATSAAPVQGLSLDLQNNRIAHGLQAEGYTYSIQIMLDRQSYRDYYWELYVGPYGERANPCPTDHKPFHLAVMSKEFNYARNDINHPPNPPALSEILQLYTRIGS